MERMAQVDGSRLHEPMASIAELTVADVMTAEPVFVTETESVAAAWELLARGNFHHLPVVRSGRCVGMLDDRTLLGAWRPGSPSRSQRKVADLLSPTLATVAPSATVPEVATLLRSRSIDAAPVVDGTGRLLGVVTASDLVRLLARQTR